MNHAETPVHAIDLVLKKRDGGEFTAHEIEQLVHMVVRLGADNPDASGEPISEAQLGALLMAIFQRGLTRAELAQLTLAMRRSGEVFDASGLDLVTVDKHSTGGVGDKTSLLIAPIVAAAGAASTPRIGVPMISGRSLGHTGGTLDKLETIPGFQTQLPLDRMRAVLRQCGAVMVGQTPRLVPADRVLYAMRDHTGTVESPFLITASIMSKKLAEDLRALVLDVKVGSGAFMPSYDASRLLAELMVSTGEAAGTRTVALLTSMDEPLGRFSGNWVEVWECVDILRGNRHPMSADLIELSCVLAGWMLHLAGRCASPAEGATMADDLLKSGAAWNAWTQIVAAQGGDLSAFEDPASMHKPKARATLTADRAGYLTSMDCREIGWAVQRLGAGRTRPGEPVSAHAGIESHAKLAMKVESGQPLFTLFSEDPALLSEPLAMMREAIRIEAQPAQRAPLIREVVQTSDTGDR